MKKKILSLVLVLSLVMSMFMLAFTSSAASTKKGDANGDGEVTSNDALLILRAAAGIEDSLSDEAKVLCDIDEDGYISLFDARRILRAAAGLTNLEKRNILSCILNAGAGRAVLIEEPLAAALGTGVMLDKPYGTMIVNVGAGTTSVAVVTMGSIAVAKSAKIGGADMDEKIKAYLKEKGKDTSDMTTKEIERANTGSYVFLDGVCSPTDAMEDLNLGMYLFQALEQAA